MLAGFFMSATYSYGANIQIDAIRALIRDTKLAAPGPVWQDEEILMFYQLQALQWQTGQFYTQPSGAFLPTTPVPYLRVAAMMLEAWSCDRARIAITKQLDTSLNPAAAAKAMLDTAQRFRDVDDDAGAFAIIEQCCTSWQFHDRFWAQVQRQAGGF